MLGGRLAVIQTPLPIGDDDLDKVPSFIPLFVDPDGDGLGQFPLLDDRIETAYGQIHWLTIGGGALVENNRPTPELQPVVKPVQVSFVVHVVPSSE